MAVEQLSAEAIAFIDATDSLLSQAVVRLAQAVAYEAIDHTDASVARASASMAFAELGSTAAGWEPAFRAAASGGVADDMSVR